MAFINPNIFQIDWDDLIGWADLDGDGGVSEIDPAGQLHLDCRAMSANGKAHRRQDLGTIGTGDYYVEIRFKGDTWDGFGNEDWGIILQTPAGTDTLLAHIGNDFVSPAGDGILIFDGSTRRCGSTRATR